ncbi:TetR/AcrR family transcriptional regulator [Burkholderia sp. Tr-20390]|uniref:TetR/AcrR family transcriptional regulator n=1 Tax=Burkholderia sp. Tr-20390 TaxID=2703904 RepID=UPI0019819ADA|nr:TetR/AcrR family transcriptional regulator [Burkholderia sp. Tr-20390]MBN3730738.1 helix-turn-helix transcriptional regulator [Burkholderia sp. Tr-20390]
MDRLRLTCAERREAARERLLDAARAIFAEKGYAAASVEDIAVAAGHTRGAFYSNFRGKADVLFERLRRDQDEAVEALQRIVGSHEPDEDARRTMLAYWRRGTTQPASHPMWLDAQLQAARDPQFRARFGALLRDRNALVAASIDAYAARARMSLPLPTPVLALGLIALCDGMQSHGAAEARSTADTLADAVRVGFITHTVVDRVRG